MAWHETAARWGVTAGAVLTVSALIRGAGRRIWAWFIAPWWSRAFLDRLDAFSGEIGLLSRAIADLAAQLVTADGTPLRAAIHDHLTDAERRLGEIDRDIRAVDARLDACILANRRHWPPPDPDQRQDPPGKD